MKRAGIPYALCTEEQQLPSCDLVTRCMSDKHIGAVQAPRHRRLNESVVVCVSPWWCQNLRFEEAHWCRWQRFSLCEPGKYVDEYVGAS